MSEIRKIISAIMFIAGLIGIIAYSYIGNAMDSKWFLFFVVIAIVGLAISDVRLLIKKIKSRKTK